MKDLETEMKKHREDYEKWENSLEGIHYNLGTIGDALVSDDEDKALIVKTLQKLPKDIRERILDDAIFVLLSAYGTVCSLCLPMPSKSKKHLICQPLIMLNFALMRNEGVTDDVLMDTVAHECAHFILGHHTLEQINNPIGEREADDLVERWGFKRAYDNYEQFEWVAKYKQK